MSPQFSVFLKLTARLSKSLPAPQRSQLYRLSCPSILQRHRVSIGRMLFQKMSTSCTESIYFLTMPRVLLTPFYPPLISHQNARAPRSPRTNFPSRHRNFQKLVKLWKKRNSSLYSIRRSRLLRFNDDLDREISRFIIKRDKPIINFLFQKNLNFKRIFDSR